MVWDSIKGFAYMVTLDKEYDYFDIIPELEGKFRQRFKVNEDQLTVISAFDTSKRLENTDWLAMYCDDTISKRVKENNQWGNNDASEALYIERKESYEKELPIQITDEENKFIEKVINYLANKCKSSEWMYYESFY